MRHRPLLPLAIPALVWLFALVGALYVPAADRWLLGQFYAGGHPQLAAAAATFTNLGGWLALLLVTLLGAAFLIARRRGRDAVLLIAITLGGRLLVEAQKLVIARARPDLPHLDVVHSFSFPSAHSANTMITGLTLALLLAGRCHAVVLAFAFAFAIGCTRMMLGVHWPSDVLAGWAFGAFWVLATLAAFKRI